MSVLTAGRQSGAPRNMRRPERERPAHDRPIRVTLRRAKFASVLCIGGLMFGVVSNAMLFQNDRPPVLPAMSAIQSPPTVQRVATLPQVPIGRPEEQTPPAIAPLANPGVDPLPTGVIAPPARPHPKVHTPTTRPSSRHEDGISTFLRASTRSAAASIR